MSPISHRRTVLHYPTEVQGNLGTVGPVEVACPSALRSQVHLLLFLQFSICGQGHQKSCISDSLRNTPQPWDYFHCYFVAIILLLSHVEKHCPTMSLLHLCHLPLHSEFHFVQPCVCGNQATRLTFTSLYGCAHYTSSRLSPTVLWPVGAPLRALSRDCHTPSSRVCVTGRKPGTLTRGDDSNEVSLLER